MCRNYQYGNENKLKQNSQAEGSATWLCPRITPGMRKTLRSSAKPQKGAVHRSGLGTNSKLAHETLAAENAAQSLKGENKTAKPREVPHGCAPASLRECDRRTNNKVSGGGCLEGVW